MKTITVKGKVYQIGALYKGDRGQVGELKAADESENYPFILLYLDDTSVTTSPQKTLSYINKNDLGTIEDAPLEIKKGETWMCHYEMQTGNETCEHFDRPFYVYHDGRFSGIPIDALLFTPKYKMVKA